MSFLSRAESWTNILKNVVIIGGIVFAVFFLIISVYANVTEDKSSSVPKPPDVDKAAYEVRIVNTGNILYTDDFEQSGNSVYILHGYWEIHDGKYKQRKFDIVLDEKFFGSIIIKKR